MRVSVVAGILLIVVGAVALAYPAITYTERDEVVDVGPLEITTESQESIPIPPIIGGLLIAAGVGFLVARPRRG